MNGLSFLPALVAIGGVALAPIAVGLLLGVDRRVTAAMQLRIGPPVLQPLYDLTKLAAKESLPADRLAAALLVAHACLAGGALGILLAGGDLVVAVLVMGGAQVLFILAAAAVESPYAQLGASRELVVLVAAEPLLLLVAIAYGSVAGSFSAAAVAAAPPPVLVLPTLGLTLAVLLAVALRKSPFDLATSHHAHQELVKGSTTEMAGRWLALAELGHWYEAAFVLALIALAAFRVPLVAAALMASAYLVVVLADNTLPRATWRAALIVAWGLGGAAAVIALITGQLLVGGSLP
jgi:ech hydrogenase subunit B